MIDIIYGRHNKPTQMSEVAEVIPKENDTGTFYIGYPTISTSPDERIEIDGMLVSRNKGAVAILLCDTSPNQNAIDEWQQLTLQQDTLYIALNGLLAREPGLRKGRDLAIKPQIITVFPAEPSTPQGIEGIFCSIENIPSTLHGLPQFDEAYFVSMQAAMQKVLNMRPDKKRSKVKEESSSRGAIMKKMGRYIANLDQWQRRAALECPDAPQRIRGLAGSGKTIVLALKAAYLHFKNEDWNIAITFQSRALYQQFTELVTRFYYDHAQEEPNWDKLHILHAWGGIEGQGLYKKIAEHYDSTYYSFLAAANKFGRNDAFKGACDELLLTASEQNVSPLFDAVLIDEAQDLPPSFFQLVYKVLTKEKRVVWAYDELQKLSEASMPSTTELFGVNTSGKPLVKLGDEHGPRQDVILRVCYRNTPWALSLAHALGFGIYRSNLVQHFEPPSLWEEIGYQKVAGELMDNKEVTLERRTDSYPGYFNELLDKGDAIKLYNCKSEESQAVTIAANIKKNLEEDELDFDDILIIVPDAYKAKPRYSLIREALLRLGIKSHLAGVTSSRDELFTKDSIAVANIYRSKGNEAPMVYIADAQHCYAGHELITLRNTLFTAITRSRAWVRIMGYGHDMSGLISEIEACRSNDYRLKFVVPDHKKRAELRLVHRDRTESEKTRVKALESKTKELLELIDSGDLSVENLPPALRTLLAKVKTVAQVEGNVEESFEDD